MQVTVRGKLFPEKDQARKLDELMRLQSSCMRYSYNRLCEGKSKSEVELDLKKRFSKINSRYRRGGYFRAKANYKSALKLVEANDLESPEKVVFGGRENLKKREQGEISNGEWKHLRNSQLYSRGDESKNGNLNLRFVEKDGELHLRVNVGDKKWIHVPAYLPEKVEDFLSGEIAYGVRILREDGEYELRVGYEENHKTSIDFDKGAIGVDFNHDSIDLAVTNNQGQLKDQTIIECHPLTTARKEKRRWLVGNFAKKVVEYAKYRQRGLVIERLDDVARSQDNQHKFTHKKFLEAVSRRAKREEVKIREVNPAYTSVIGGRKYVPYYHITVHQASALVIARRGQGYREKLKGLKSLLPEPSEGEREGEGAPSRRAHSWSLWSLIGSLGPHNRADYTHPDQSPETIGVESSGTSSLTSCEPSKATERSPGGGDTPGAETASPGSGPPTREVVA